MGQARPRRGHEGRGEHSGGGRTAPAAGAGVQLRPFGPGHLPLAQPWFSDPDTQRWLGGPGWLPLMLNLADRPLGEFRGATETRRHHWLAWANGTVVGYTACDTYDRWTTWEGGPGGRGVTATIPVSSAGIAYVVDPAQRRRGYGTAMITAVTAMPELAHVELFAAGVEPENTASVGCLRKAGFRPLSPEPDWEGTVYYALFRADCDTPGKPA
jgi:RimJ/RimL family protein N-acetyltransferase